MKTTSNRTLINRKVVDATSKIPGHRLPVTHKLYDAWMYTANWQADVSKWNEEMVEFARKCVSSQKNSFYNNWSDEQD